MTSPKKLYKLEFLLDAGKHNTASMLKKVNVALGALKKGLDIQVEPETGKRLRLCIEGSLSAVDRAHGRLNKKFIKSGFAVRTIDEAGTELRDNAFRVVAEIEQALRAFIHRVTTETVGFGWWEKWSSPTARNRAVTVLERARDTGGFQHPIELIDFDHLIDLITINIRELSGEQAFTISGFLEILNECNTFEELKNLLAERTTPRSAWDNIYALYFADKDSWSQMSIELKEHVIPARNKIMHHRPFHQWELDKITEVRNRLLAILNTAERPPKPEQEKIKVVSAELSRVAKPWMGMVMVQTAEPAQRAAEALKPIGRLIDQWNEPALRMAEVMEPFRRLIDQVSEPARMAAEAMEPFRRLIDQVNEPARRVAEAMEPFRRLIDQVNEPVLKGG